MKLTSYKLSLLLGFLFCNFYMFAQSISGFVYDESNNPVPYAKVYFKDRGNSGGSGSENSGAITDFEGKYFLGCSMGVQTLVITCIGFKNLEVQVTVNKAETTIQNVYLKQVVQDVEGVSVSAKKRNMGWMIVRNVIGHKKEMIRQMDGYTCEIYIKGVETFDKKKKPQKAVEEKNEPVDIFQEEEDKVKEILKKEARLNMIEINLTKHFQYPKDIKEIRTGYEKIGNPNQIYYQSTVGGEFNFYKSLVNKDDLHLGPIVSPLHPSGILSYKYKLTEIQTEGNDTIYVIKVSSRSVGNSTLSGFLYIKKHDWVLTKVDLAMHKGNLKIYDDFRIIQEFVQLDSLWLLDKQVFEYKTKYGKETVLGKTTVDYSDYKINPEFPKKFFSNELGVTTKEAYERDSTYWDKIRPIPLTLEEQRSKFVQDSVQAIYTSKIYLDSVDSVYNKVTFLKVAFLGVGHMNRDNKTRWMFPSVVSLVEPIAMGGIRFGPYVSYFKKWKNSQWISISSSLNIGYNNLDIRGSATVYHHYNPKKLSTYFISGSKSGRMINSNNAISSLLNRQNIYQNIGLNASHITELFNGLYIFNSFRLDQRYQFDLDYKFVTWLDAEFENTEPVQFEKYNSFRTLFYITYVPAQKYMTEPDRKVVLGSAWPKFTVGWEKGWNQVFNSVVDFDYLYLSVRQSFQIRTFGESKYNLVMGQFVNQDSVQVIDRKYFRQADKNKWLALAFIDPLHNFQNLDSTYETKDLYIQGHYIHHFNGAIVNKIPFMKKTGVKTVAGAGFIFLPEHDNYFYTEAYIGVERIFKIFRERVRIGTYIIGSTQNNSFKFPDDQQPRHFKFAISFDIMNNDANDFNF
ncbi:MAG: carboxypeptidase-like regulatory domain-containing protein [Crocinitomicaceae bacterium]|nr:carboxypeptidase-like regulatory domain-containing protein [Crocinitomicaceae bacterium]